MADYIKFTKEKLKYLVGDVKKLIPKITSGKGTPPLEVLSEGEIYLQLDESDISTSGYDEFFESYFKLQRTGKIYGAKIWKSAINPTSSCEKTRDNVGLVCKPSTDTVEAQDDYADIPLFKWYECNYKRYDDGFAYPTAMLGDSAYSTSGPVDCGALQMTFYYKYIDNDSYTELIISDSPNNALGLEPWPLAVRSDGTVKSYFVQSRYNSSTGTDGFLRSLPNQKITRNQSHNTQVSDYQKKGKGYWGSGSNRYSFAQIFSQIKFGTKDIQSVMQGCTGWSFQYKASIQSEDKNTYFPVTTAQANALYVGAYVSVGYGRYDNSTLNLDRGIGTIHTYADDVKILKKENIDSNNVAIYLDCEPFNTKSITDSSGNTLDIYMSSMHSRTGETDVVIGHHDGSPVSNTNAIFPCRIQGIEFFCGPYIVASDTAMFFNSDYSKDVYYAPRGVSHSTSDSVIKSTYTKIGTIPASSDGGGNDYWIGDVTIKDGVWYPSSQIASQNSYKDRLYAGGKQTSVSREYLQGGDLRNWSYAGLACLYCWRGLGPADWYFASAD